MNYKNTKTILFASLIAAMILPFGMMNNAVAEEEQTDLQKIKKVIKAYKVALNNAETDEEKEKIQQGLDRLILGKKILKQIQNANSFTTLSEAQSTNSNIKELVEKLDATYDATESNNATNDLTTQSSEIDVNLWRSYSQSAYDCATESNTQGTTNTNFKSYTSGAATISTSFNYPATYSEKAFPWSDCVTFNHDRTTERHYVLTSYFPGVDPGSGQACHTEVSSATGSDSTSCSNFGPALVTVVILENEYGNNVGVQLGWIGGGLVFS